MAEPWKNSGVLKSNIPESEISLKTAIKAGKEILNFYGTDFTSKMKEVNSPITNAIESFLLIYILKTFCGIIKNF